MARKTQNTGLSAGAKVGILLVLFGLPALFFASSWGLEKLYEIAPWALFIVLLLVATAYTAYTAGLMYKFYEVDPPLLRFFPCLCEITIIDVKYHKICYILYAVSILLMGASQLPYSVIGVLGQTFATTAPFYLLLLGLLALVGVQIVKGVGMVNCIKDIGTEWQKQMHGDVGAINKFSFLSFIPFVRMMALYALNKPLSTLVTFHGSTVSDAHEDRGFDAEEAEDEDEY